VEVIYCILLLRNLSYSEPLVIVYSSLLIYQPHVVIKPLINQSLSLSLPPPLSLSLPSWLSWTAYTLGPESSSCHHYFMLIGPGPRERERERERVGPLRSTPSILSDAAQLLPDVGRSFRRFLFVSLRGNAPGGPAVWNMLLGNLVR